MVFAEARVEYGVKQIKKIFKYYFTKYKLIFLFFLGIFLMLLYGVISKFSPTWTFIFTPIILPPAYVINLLQNMDDLNLLDGTYFFNINVGYSLFWILPFLILGATFFCIVAAILTGKNKKAKKIILYFFFIFFVLGLIFKSFAYYLAHDSSGLLMSGNDNLKIFLTDITIVSMCIVILSRINKIVNLEFLCKTFIKYTFTILKISLTLFIGLIFVNIYVDGGESTIYRFLLPLSVVTIGFLFFLLLELIQNYFLNKMQ